MFLDEISVFLYVSEKEAVIAFPLGEGGFDYIAFSSTDSTYQGYCCDVFNHYYEIGEPAPNEKVLSTHEIRKAFHSGNKRGE